MNEYRLRDARGRVQRIAAKNMGQALMALDAINRENDRQADGGAALAESWSPTECAKCRAKVAA